MSHSFKRKCEVCDRERECYVVCSSFGAMSYGACDACLMHEAEPLYVFDYLVMMGGADVKRMFGDDIVDVKSFENRDYITFGQWIEGKNLAAMQAQMEHDFQSQLDKLQPSAPPDSAWGEATDIPF